MIGMNGKNNWWSRLEVEIDNIIVSFAFLRRQPDTPTLDRNPRAWIGREEISQPAAERFHITSEFNGRSCPVRSSQHHLLSAVVSRNFRFDYRRYPAQGQSVQVGTGQTTYILYREFEVEERLG